MRAIALCSTLWVIWVRSTVQNLAIDTSLTKDKHICFYSNTAGERGAEIAMYDYAEYAERMLQMKSTVVFPKILESSNPMSDQLAADFSHIGVGGLGCRMSLQKFASRFNVSFCGEPYSPTLLNSVVNTYEIDQQPYSICKKLSWEAKHNIGCDLLYIIKSGRRQDSPQFPGAFGELPTLVHAVFNWEPHGTVYAGISPAIKSYRPRDNGNIVPHMVVPPDPIQVAQAISYHQQFDIPHKALVVCRHGGNNTFNIPFVKQGILDLLDRYNESRLHFVFLGTEKFQHDFTKLALNTTKAAFYLGAGKRQIHFLPATTDAQLKENYFATCDVMLHARHDGETFGLAVAEFSVRNKPVITQQAGRRYSDFHLRVLGDKAILYGHRADFVEKVSSLVRHGVPKDVQYNCYQKFQPAQVMSIFKRVFLDSALPFIGKNVTNVATIW